LKLIDLQLIGPNATTILPQEKKMSFFNVLDDVKFIDFILDNSFVIFAMDGDL
jgi:hypothetical protein